MDLTLDFLRMSVPLARLVKGVPGYEIPEEIGSFACDALEMGIHPERIDERLELFHHAERNEAATKMRVYGVLQYAYYWLCRMVREEIMNTKARDTFLCQSLDTSASIQFAVEATRVLLREHQDYVGEDPQQHDACTLGLVEALSDFLAALNSALSVHSALRHKPFYFDATVGPMIVPLPPASGTTPLTISVIIKANKPLSQAFMNPVATHFAQCAWRATAAACEYFAPNGSGVYQGSHGPYQKQWRRIALEMLDMCVTYRPPDFTDPAYWSHAVAPSWGYFQATRGATSRLPNAPFQSRTLEHCESQALPQRPVLARSFVPNRSRSR